MFARSKCFASSKEWSPLAPLSEYGSPRRRDFFFFFSLEVLEGAVGAGRESQSPCDLEGAYTCLTPAHSCHRGHAEWSWKGGVAPGLTTEGLADVAAQRGSASGFPCMAPCFYFVTSIPADLKAKNLPLARDWTPPPSPIPLQLQAA